MTQSIFSNQAFMRFWMARLVGNMANMMLMVALAWHMYDLTGSAWDLGLVGLFQFVPSLLMTLPAGHVADRLHRGRIFAACMVLQAVVALLLVAATMAQAGRSDTRGQLYEGSSADDDLFFSESGRQLSVHDYDIQLGADVCQ